MSSHWFVCFLFFTETQMKNKNKNTGPHCEGKMQHKCETIKEATEKQRKKLSEKREEMEERKKRIEGAKEEVRKEEEERKRDINTIFNEIRGEVEIQRQKMIERCEIISKRKGSFHYYFFLNTNKTKQQRKQLKNTCKN